MSVGIIVPGLPNYAPYLKSYTELFDDLNIDYTFICWNRNNDSLIVRENMIVFDRTLYERSSFLKKCYGYFLFSIFVRRHLNLYDYTFLTIHTLACGIFVKKILNGKRYFLDIRDYSPLVPYFKSRISALIRQSSGTFISSLAYKRWLPLGFRYILSHNVRKSELVNSERYSRRAFNNEIVKVLTIGQLRDFSANSAIIDELGNKSNIFMDFVGEGTELSRLTKHAESYDNIRFTGRYEKEEELGFIENADLINIVLPNTFEALTQMTNRFYLSLLYKRPMIVNEDSIQADFVRDYNLGIVVGKDENVYDEINSYISRLDYDLFCQGCNDCIKVINRDISKFENYLKINLVL